LQAYKTLLCQEKGQIRLILLDKLREFFALQLLYFICVLIYIILYMNIEQDLNLWFSTKGLGKVYI